MTNNHIPRVDDDRKPDPMTDPIKRLEAASGPDRELDVEIAKLSGTYDSYEGALYYTSSIDAALTLVPEGWLLETLSERNALGDHNWRWKAELWNSTASRRIGDDAPIVCGIARAAHNSKCAPAIAICIAALKARKGD